MTVELVSLSRAELSTRVDEVLALDAGAPFNVQLIVPLPETFHSTVAEPLATFTSSSNVLVSMPL